MSEEQIRQLGEGIKDISLEIKLVWQKLSDIGITMAQLPCKEHRAEMKTNNKEIERHIKESDAWRRAILISVIGSITSVVIAVSAFVTVKVTLEKHIEYSNKYFTHIEKTLGN